MAWGALEQRKGSSFRRRIDVQLIFRRAVGSDMGRLPCERDPATKQYEPCRAGVAESADAADSKSAARKGMGVRVPPPAPARRRAGR